MSRADDNDQFDTAKSSKIRSLAEQFEQAWDAQQDTSKGIDLLPFLPDAGDPLRLPMLYELIKTDLSCRWGRGLPTSLENYVEKFPEIGPLDKVATQLIYEEYRIRTKHGYPAPLTQYQTRFPNQYAELERLIQAEQAHMTAPSRPTIGNPTAGLSNATGAQQPEDSPLALLKQGTRVGGHYTLSKRIGSGGFGEVWLGNDIHGNIPKAIKIISRSVESDEAKTELHALEIIKRLNHPYLLRTEGFFAEQERLIVVMELADGSLREMLKKAKKETDNGLPVEKLLVYMRHAAEALDYLHEEGIFHRDIKPENILLVGKIAKVADFGLAKLAANRQSTKTNFAGTSAYSSPETWKGRVTNKSDLYSLAVTYAELRLGRAVFKGSTIYEFMIEHLQSQPNLDPMPDPERDVVLRALAKDPADRYGNCSEFVRALEQAVGGPGTLPTTGLSQPSTGASISGRPTPVSKWNTPVSNRPGTNPSLNMNTQRGTGGSTKPSWKNAPSQAEIDLQEPEPTPIRRGRRRSGANPLLVGLAVMIVLGVAAAGASLFARAGVEQTVNELAEKNDYQGALKAIDDGNLLITPFREGLRKDLLETGLEAVEKARKNDKIDEQIKITSALVDAFPRDSRAIDSLGDTLKKKIPEWTARGEYAKAFGVLHTMDLAAPGKSELLVEISRQWPIKAWDEMDRQDYSAAKAMAGDFLKIDPANKEAILISDFATAAGEKDKYLVKNAYVDLMRRIPRQAPPRGQKLVEQMRSEIRADWLKYAREQVAKKRFDAAQAALNQFAEYFRDDAEGKKILYESLDSVVKTDIAAKRFDEAFKQLELAKFPFRDLTDLVKTSWRDAEVARFKAGGDADKETALRALSKLSTQFAGDPELQDVYSEYRREYVKDAIPRIEGNLKAKKYAAAAGMIKNIEPFVEDAAQATLLRSLDLLIQLNRSTVEPSDYKAIGNQLRQVMDSPEQAVHLDQILEGVIRVGTKDPSFYDPIKPQLVEFANQFDVDRLEKLGYFKIPGMTRSENDPAPRGPRGFLAEASKIFSTGDYELALKSLRKINVKQEPDKAIQRDYLNMYAKLSEKGVLSRSDVREMEADFAKQADLKPYVVKAMTQTIANDSKNWPMTGDSWESRIKDADAAEPDNPLVLAFKAEALLQLKKKVDFPLRTGLGDEKGYVDYVRALVTASKETRDDSINAARALERLPLTDPWMVPGRREQASLILENAANSLVKADDGSRRMFDSPQEATEAYRWLEKSLQFAGQSIKNAGMLPRESEITLTLASACMAQPRFDLSKSLGDDLLAKHRNDLGSARIYMVLANPNGFPKELKTMKADGEFGINEVNTVLNLALAQLADDPDAVDQKQRLAQLYALKGWKLERAPKRNTEQIYTAYGEASKYDPNNATILVAMSRYGAIDALERAEVERNSDSKLSIIQQGIQAADRALRKNLESEEGWADLCLQRSQLALVRGNELHATNTSLGMKDAFRDALTYAEKARDAKIPLTEKSQKADIWRAIGNAHEDLAEFARDDVDANYPAGVKGFEKAAEYVKDDIFNAGRCRYRWTVRCPMDEAKRIPILKEALGNLKVVADDVRKPKAAEASCWEGYTYAYLGDMDNALKSYLRSMTIARDRGGKDRDALTWAGYSLVGLSSLFDRVPDAEKKSDPAKLYRWAESAESIAQSLKSNPDFAIASGGSIQKLTDAGTDALLDMGLSDAKKKDFVSAKAHYDKAVARGHSTHAYKSYTNRAFTIKLGRTALNVSAKELDAVRQEAITAIETSSLSAEEIQRTKAAFDQVWKSIP